jgi:glycine cleavage system regulatory protein
MNRTLVMTIIGPDRPGLVEAVAALVARHGGNWLESRMSRLGGQFAGILRVETPVEQQAALVDALKQLNSAALTVVVQPDEEAGPEVPRCLHLLELTGQDRPGIVRQIAGVLASDGVNVEELETELTSAAMSGETLFHASAKVSFPPNCDVSRVRSKLERIAEDLIVEISLAQIPPTSPMV